ncbi:MULTISPECIES: site-specific integrase [unclassified Alteromonas]|jgi:integrase|uniref:site-specific integrase n=1 Tax=unclassified Alteromonas TaxID=2614992 RepID=UPI001EF31B88|nr:MULTISPECIES: site-specific integrase [unclassified Alteromonas]MCG7639151.1 site-specific integrase [Alteromonas sp. CNT1-28]MCG7813134.1 site-specific integrase [Alteromonas sp. MCA-1]
MATITKRENGKWQAKCRKKGYKTLSKTFSRKFDAEKWAKQVELEMEQGIFESTATAERTLVSSLLERFWDEVASNYRSADNIKYKLNFLSKVLGHIHLIDLSVDVVREFKLYRLETVSGDTARKELSLLKRMVDHAMKEWNIYLPKGNPFYRVSLPTKGKARDRRLASGEFERLMEEAKTYGGSLPIVIELAIETAMRRGELINLKWDNVDLHKRTAFLPETKNGTTRTVPLSGRAVELVGKITRQGDYLFPLEGDSVGQAFRRVTKRAGISDLRFHDLRHEATSRFFERGLQIMEVSAITGHKDLAMLKRYTHLDAEVLALKL